MRHLSLSPTWHPNLPPVLLGAILFLLGAVFLLGLLVLWQSGRSRRRARRIQRRGKAGEEQAVALMSRAGYEVVAAQHGGAFAVEADGELWTFSLRADFLVRRRRDGRFFIAEVKTGEFAPRLSHGPTRRQLLEYSLAYRDRACGVLLVAPELGEVTCVRFPAIASLLRPGLLKGSRWVLLMGGVVIGAAGSAAAGRAMELWRHGHLGSAIQRLFSF